MKRILGWVSAGTILMLAVWVSGQQPPKDIAEPSFRFRAEGEAKPFTHLNFNNHATTFRFAIVSDRTGGPRAGVFERAMDQLNLMQPEFVMCVGDLISSAAEGEPRDPVKNAKRWEEMRSWTGKLEMPFFYLPGNHDIRNELTQRAWKERFGQTYYHFLYKDTLFLMLNTEELISEKPGRDFPTDRFSDEQLAYAEKVLRANPEVRWTFVFLHRPFWSGGNAVRTKWVDLEKHLEGRKYTVFAGHIHAYEMSTRKGMKHIILGTTGAASALRGPAFGELDHITWVTMKNSGPVIVNHAMVGILPEDFKTARRE